LRILGLLALGLVVGCVTTRVLDYRARPVGQEGPEEDARIRVERPAYRVLAGPPSAFPYGKEVGRRARQVGRYHLYTRIFVENTGAAELEVGWPDARLVAPDGSVLRLVEGRAGEDGGGAPAGPAGGAGRGAASAVVAAPPVDRLRPGEGVVRALLPETVRSVAVYEPLVSLCDGCEYRLIIPLRVAGRPDSVALGFRLEAERGRGPGRVRLFFLQ